MVLKTTQQGTASGKGGKLNVVQNLLKKRRVDPIGEA